MGIRNGTSFGVLVAYRPNGQVMFDCSADVLAPRSIHHEITLTAADPGGQEPEQNFMTETVTSQPLLTAIDVRIRLAALWVVTMFVYAYVDIFSLMRADFLTSLLDGEILNTPFTVDQRFLVFTLLYILPACLMVYFSLTLGYRANRRANMIVAGLYAVTVALSCIGEEWLYYLLGSAIEVVLLGLIFRLAWGWSVDSNHY